MELSVMEQRYHAVMEVLSGAPVTEVAGRYGVSPKTVHTWKRRYREGGPLALADRSHRPHHHPWQLSAETEALICKLRRAHRRWGPRRLRHELARRGVDPPPSLSSVYRVLVRNHLVEARPRKRRREDYVSWEREQPMELWQLDIKGGFVLLSGGEAKLISGLDDHSRFCVIAELMVRASGRRVCSAFVGALERYGIPEEVLTDNGKQFTGRFGKPRPAEVLFERICRMNAITHRKTPVRTPTTTGKVERFHQTIQQELLDDQAPFEDLAHAQAALDAFVDDYNNHRPHQSLAMATPASRFRAIPAGRRKALRLWLPPQLVAAPIQVQSEERQDDLNHEHALVADADAVEVDRVVPPGGNLTVAQQQFWIGPLHAGRSITLWIDTKSVHLSLEGRHLKTLPSRLGEAELARLRSMGARAAGPPLAPPAAMLARGVALEVERTVNACGLVGLGGVQVGAGQPLAGRRVTLRLERDLIHVIADGVLQRTVPSPPVGQQWTRLRGARVAGPAPHSQIGPTTVRRVSVRGAIRVATQRVQVGLAHAREVVTVELHDTVLRVVDDDGEILKIVP
ncbi:MAG TPA: IS481 family transposase, partial [Actinomycetota bacterium]|nr:IS481 family transposase [Actinomycetota bacterium]